MHLRASQTVRPLDLVTMARVPRALLRQWSQLTFEDGLLVDRAGVRRGGVRIEAGTHPSPGTRYLVTTEAEVLPPPTEADQRALRTLVHDGVAQDVAAREWLAQRRERARAAGTMEVERTTAAIELLDDRPDRFRVRVQDRTATTVGAVLSIDDVQDGRHPSPVSWDIELDGAMHEPRRLASKIRGGAHVVLDRSGPGGTPRLRIKADAAHKWGRGRARITVTQVERKQDVAVDLSFRGAGIARPLAAVVTVFARNAVHKAFQEMMDDLPGQVVAFLDEMHLTLGPEPTADEIATSILDELISSTATDAPED